MIPKNLLPEAHNEYVVAGGWAVCPALATDMDLFILAGPHADLPEVRQEVINHLKVEGFDFTEQEEMREFIGYDGLVGIGKVAKVDTGTGKEIHILIASTTRVEDVLGSFDLSVCMVGITNTGRVVTDNCWTPPTAPIAVTKHTPTTDARLAKYVERFQPQRQETFIG